MSISLPTIHENSIHVINYDFPIYDPICRKAIREAKNLPISEIFNILKNMVIHSNLNGSDLLFFINMFRYILPALTSDEIYKINRMIYKHIPLYHQYRYILLSLFN